jgi:copper chaperone CopZ
MQEKTIKVPNISCGHCVRTIESEVGMLENVLSVKAHEESKLVEIAWDEPQQWQNIKSLLEEINYPPEE